MKSALIGHSGFVGGNLVRQTTFTNFYRSTDIETIEGKEFDLLVCSGVTAVKWWANKNAEEDRGRIDKLIGHLQKVTARRVFIISTVDVYPVSTGVDESFDCHKANNHAYGTNRLYFEDAMLAQFPEAMIPRLGGLFGPGLKKNLIFDLMHDNGLENINLDSAFQFYDMNHLWKDLLQMEAQRLKLVNLVTEPVVMREVVKRMFPDKQVGATPAPRAAYDIRTLHDKAMGGANGYLASKESVLDAMQEFVNTNSGSGLS